MERLSRRLLKTNAARAAIAQAWVDGVTQKDIAKAFGYKNSTSINVAVMKLIRTFCPEWCIRDCVDGKGPMVEGDARKPLAQKAVDRYHDGRDSHQIAL